MPTPYSGGASSVNHPDSATPDHQHTIVPSSHSSEPAGSEIGPVVPGAPGFEAPQTRISCGAILATSVDTLKLSLYLEWSSLEVFQKLQVAKELAQEQNVDCMPIELFGHSWNVSRAGVHAYSYRLVSGDVRLMLSQRQANSDYPNAILEIGSMSCWAPGYMEIYQGVIRMLERWGGILAKERVSEVHLCADVVGQSLKDLPCTDEDYWITRAHRFAVFHNRRKLTGITIGKGDIMLRVYDKVAELAAKSTHKQGFFANAWGLETFDQTDVTRFEFQLRRKVITQFQPGINTVQDLTDHLQALWDYCVGDWARLTATKVDRDQRHQDRAVLHSVWDQLRAAIWTGKKICERIQRQLQGDFDRLCKQAAGLSMSIASFCGLLPDDVDGIVQHSQMYVEREIRRIWRVKAEFVNRMRRKTCRLVDPLVNVAEVTPF